jgi:predicted phosphodiesterase
MKIAVLSDIHGNIGALDAVLADIERRGVDVTVNLGDIVSGPLHPAETADRLMPLRLPTIKGNHERQLLTLAPDRMNASDRYAAAMLTAEHRAWLTSLPAQFELADDVLLLHGGPDSDLTYLLETVEPSGRRAATPDEIAPRLPGIRAALVLCGHTHIPRDVRLPDGRRIVNPGSVGLQAYAEVHPHPHTVENESPHARYAIVERTASVWNVELLTVEYDWEGAAVLADSRGRPEWARALRTGRA